MPQTEVCRFVMNSGRLVVILILFMLGPRATLVAQKCSICDSALGVYHYRVRDQFGDEEKLICGQCMLLKERCFLCGLPVKNGLTRLRDGRVFCARDVNEVVLSDDDAKSICSGTKNELDRIFSRFLTFPETNVVISMVDRVHMDGLFESAGFDRQCPSVFGYVKSRIVEGEKWEHPISILKVRYANSNAWVRCIEIHDHSVVIQVEGAPERQELFLKVK